MNGVVWPKVSTEVSIARDLSAKQPFTLHLLKTRVMAMNQRLVLEEVSLCREDLNAKEQQQIELAKMERLVARMAKSSKHRNQKKPPPKKDAGTGKRGGRRHAASHGDIESLTSTSSTESTHAAEYREVVSSMLRRTIPSKAASSSASGVGKGTSSASGIGKGTSFAASGIAEGASSSASGVGKGAPSSASGIGKGTSSAASGIAEGASSSASAIGKGASKGASALEPPPPPPPPPRPPRTNFGRLVSTIGNASIYEDNKNGQHIGYIITCGRHLNNGDDPRKIECKKYLSFGSGGRGDVLSADECIRRLKRWYVRGEYGKALEPANKLRTAHIESAGHRCALMASEIPQWSSITDEELDDMVSRISP